MEGERAALEQQLRLAQKMGVVGQLAGGIAHDFNNLLTAILGYTQMAQGLVSAEGRLGTLLQEAHKGAERAAELTRQLLAFSRNEVSEQRSLDINELIVNIHRMLRRLIGEELELVRVTANDLGLITADRIQIEQVLINLAINARDAMPNGGKLTIETSNATLDQADPLTQSEVVPGDYVRLAVTDDGAGMTEDVRARIFDPFFTTKANGTGLGLSTSRAIVRQHGGHISVWSEPGKGTSFEVYLPRTDPAVSEQGSPHGAASLVAGTNKELLVEGGERAHAVHKAS